MNLKRRWFINPLADGNNKCDVMTEVKEGAGSLISSELADAPGLHSPIIDLDFPAMLVPSSTPGHFHLYLSGLTLPAKKYEKLLTALHEAGVVEAGIVKQFKTKGATFARPPWRPKSAKAPSSV